MAKTASLRRVEVPGSWLTIVVIAEGSSMEIPRMGHPTHPRLAAAELPDGSRPRRRGFVVCIGRVACSFWAKTS